VDDEPLLLGLYARILEGVGYEVWRAHDGDSALNRIGRRDIRPLVVVTDLKMAPMGGVELGRHLAARLPALPVLYLSGSPDDAMQLEIDDRLGHFLQKPFAPQVLLRRVQALCGLQPATAD
jgi:two-component system, cell cycle sensor histidine kinase and response regulator CckA